MIFKANTNGHSGRFKDSFNKITIFPFPKQKSTLLCRASSSRRHRLL
jgi:hypothetical protein